MTPPHLDHRGSPSPGGSNAQGASAPIWVIRLSLIGLIFFAIAVVAAIVALVNLPAAERSALMWTCAIIAAVGVIIGARAWVRQRYGIASAIPLLFILIPISEAFLPGFAALTCSLICLVILGFRALNAASS